MNKFCTFQTDISSISLPEKFTFPFYYEPHELARIATLELQDYLKNQQDFKHNFGLPDYEEGLIIGKMFGVLVVQEKGGKISYLAAVSGKMASSNHHDKFVPPVFDILTPGGFFTKEENELNKINRAIEKLEKNPNIMLAKEVLEATKLRAANAIEHYKAKVKLSKKIRLEARKKSENETSQDDFQSLKTKHEYESLFQQFQLKEMIAYYKELIDNDQHLYEREVSELKSLKAERKQRSGKLQQKVFNEYYFLNAKNERKSLHDIFQVQYNVRPPAGSGECAAPKLLHYAYQHDCKPIAMAEFWWGQGPKSQVRKHQEFYPACRSKCEPILGHMLEGLEIEENPLLSISSPHAGLEIVYEDDDIVVVNKASEFLSVPGKTTVDSVQNRLKTLYPESTGPLLVHRLDMSTSGILLAAKSLEMHKDLQAQFMSRTVKKRYTAILEGEVIEKAGLIDLPLRVDLDNRPRQLICYEHGKVAKTSWKKLDFKNGRTRIAFFPVTGRTHQLRVHAAHKLGLNCAIVGDDLYGKKDERLMLHAAGLKFRHPRTNEPMEIKIKAPF